jgi:hypothetical protein
MNMVILQAYVFFIKIITRLKGHMQNDTISEYITSTLVTNSLYKGLQNILIWPATYFHMRKTKIINTNAKRRITTEKVTAKQQFQMFQGCPIHEVNKY